MVKIVELKLDRNLIKSNFDGYKLSLESIPVIKRKLDFPPLSAKLLENQFSFLHAELFSLQNLLVQDLWNRNTSYYIAGNGNVMKLHYDDKKGTPSFAEPVYRIPSSLFARESGDYNCSFQFLSEQYCLICNGIDTFILVDTGDRYKLPNIPWKECYRSNITDDCKNFILKDARLDIIDGNKRISCVFQRIEFDEKSHFTQLFLCHIDEKNGQWSFTLNDILCGKGSVLYCAFEPMGKSIVIGSNKKFKYKSLEDMEVSQTVENEIVKFDQEKEKQYSWSQTENDIVLLVNMNEGESQSNYNVIATEETLLVENDGNEVINGKLYSKIDDNLTNWNQEGDKLKITLIKKDANLHWTYLLEDDLIKNNFDDDKMVNLDAAMEECDFPISSEDDDHFIEKFKLDSKEVTHKIFLGKSLPLFTTALRPGSPPAFVNRNDVDASIWVQQLDPNRLDDWNFRHEGNIHAFGYVQASKQQKKFMNCSPDLNFSVICESHRHVFIYKPNNESSSGLRNRTGPQISVGKQHLVTLEDTGEVLGMQCGTEFVILLTEKFALYLQINNF